MPCILVQQLDSQDGRISTGERQYPPARPWLVLQISNAVGKMVSGLFGQVVELGSLNISNRLLFVGNKTFASQAWCFPAVNSLLFWLFNTKYYSCSAFHQTCRRMLVAAQLGFLPRMQVMYNRQLGASKHLTCCVVLLSAGKASAGTWTISAGQEWIHPTLRNSSRTMCDLRKHESVLEAGEKKTRARRANPTRTQMRNAERTTALVSRNCCLMGSTTNNLLIKRRRKRRFYIFIVAFSHRVTFSLPGWIAFYFYCMHWKQIQSNEQFELYMKSHAIFMAYKYVISYQFLHLWTKQARCRPAGSYQIMPCAAAIISTALTVILP